MNHDFIKLFRSEIRRSYWLIIGIAIIGAILLTLEKMFFSNFVIQSGNMHIEKTVVVEGNISLQDDRNILDYEKFFSSYSGMQMFLDVTEQKYDYTKFNPKWLELSDEDKLKWLQKHICVVDFKGNVCQFIFIIKETEAKDVDYINSYAENFLEDFVDLSEQRIRLVNNEWNLKEVDSTAILPESKEISKNQIVFKYAIIGAFLGIIIGFIIVVVKTMRKKYNG